MMCIFSPGSSGFCVDDVDPALLGAEGREMVFEEF
jgi:hypothetical protein